MKEGQKEEWIRLCEQAAYEENPEKLMALVREINRLLDEKNQRLQRTAMPGDAQVKGSAAS
jgi:hypothetical protein